MKTKLRPTASRGFTLVEIAIVLAVAGLLLGGVLKGQELINSAKTRAIVERQGEMQKAALLFADHFGELPGDLENASTYITGTADGGGDGIVTENESPLALNHLAAGGFLRCEACTETSTASSIRSTAENSPTNNYDGVMSLWHDTANYAFIQISGVRDTHPVRLQMHTGPRIPSNIMAQIDIRLDDGHADQGFFRFNQYDPTGAASPSAPECTELSRSHGLRRAGNLTLGATFWRSTPSRPPVHANCGGSFIIQ